MCGGRNPPNKNLSRLYEAPFLTERRFFYCPGSWCDHPHITNHMSAANTLQQGTSTATIDKPVLSIRTIASNPFHHLGGSHFGNCVRPVAVRIGRRLGGFAGASPLRAVTADPTKYHAGYQGNPRGREALPAFRRFSFGQDRCGYCPSLVPGKSGKPSPAGRTQFPKWLP